MKSSVLLKNLWKVTGSEDIREIFKNVPHSVRYINGQNNNSYMVQTATTPYSAIIEGVTNGHDAVVMDWVREKKFTTPPKNVQEALTAISNDVPQVRVYFQKPEKAIPNLTILDQGTGMTAEQMIKGVLSGGSEAKVLDPLQHGNYGFGGASLFGQCAASLIITRTRSSDRYLFVPVYKDDTDENRVDGYVYITKPDGSFFSVAADEVMFMRPGSGDWKANVSNDLILPIHGTVRRQIAMDVQYRSDHDSSLYTSLADSLFGSPGVVQLVGMTNQHSNKRRGRRHVLNALAVGEKLASGSEMLLKIPSTPVMIFDGKTPFAKVNIAAWVLSHWGDAGKSQKSPVFTMLDGKEKGVGPQGILVTLNGQKHARIASSWVMRKAGISILTTQTIIEVTLDDCSRQTLRYVIAATRSGLFAKFEDKLKDEIVNFLKNHEDLQLLARQHDVATEEPNSDIQKFVNSMMDDPLLGILAGLDTNGPNTINGSVIPKTAGSSDSEKADSKKYEVRPFVPVDPPTELSIAKTKVRHGRTEWITIRTNAPDSYGSGFRVSLPHFLDVVPGARPRLTNGKFTFPTTVKPECGIGEEGLIEATLGWPDGELRTERMISVVTVVEKPERPESGQPQDGIRQASLPRPKIVHLNGVAHELFASVFSGMEEEEPAFSFDLNERDNELLIYVNDRFGALAKVEQSLRSRFPNDAEIVWKDFTNELISNFYVAISMILCRSKVFEDCEQHQHRILAEASKCVSLTIAHRYNDYEYRRTVIKRSKQIVDE
jgi:hypothetical protein